MPLPELDDDLIEFVTQSQRENREPPRKRQKMSLERKMAGTSGMTVERAPTDGEGELDHIVIKRSVWEIQCAGSSLSTFETPLERDRIKVSSGWGLTYLSILDDTKRSIFKAHLPPNRQGLEDIYLALAVWNESMKWTKGEARLWTEFGVALLHKNGTDTLQIIFTVKWNITTSSYNVAQVHRKIPVLSKLLSTYFPDPNVSKSETWSPQDFYQSVHSPSKDDARIHRDG